MASPPAIAPKANSISPCIWFRGMAASLARSVSRRIGSHGFGRQAVEDYQQIQQLMEEISELEWKRLMERKR